MRRRFPSGACLFNAKQLARLLRSDDGFIGLAFALKHPFTNCTVDDIELQVCKLSAGGKGIIRSIPSATIETKKCFIDNRAVTSADLELEFHDYLMQVKTNFFSFITKQEFKLLYRIFPDPQSDDNWMAVSGCLLILSIEDILKVGRCQIFTLKMEPYLQPEDVNGEADGLAFYNQMRPCPTGNWS